MSIADPATLAAIQDLYDRSRFLQAHELGIAKLGPLDGWQGARGGVLAGRLAYRLGASDLSDRLHLRVHRRHPESLATCAARGRCLWGWRGPFLTWEWLSTIADDPTQPADERVDLLTEKADVLTALHDFTQADELLRQAAALRERPQWVAVSRARLHETADRMDEAEQELRRALELVPWHRLAVQALARLLYQRQQDDEAIALLRAASGHGESAEVAAQLAAILIELRHFDEARACLERYEVLTPLGDKSNRQWLAARRADVAYESGDLVGALHLSKASGHPFHQKVAEAQEQAPPDARRVLLEVPFIRQHNLTCAPATLAMLAHHWSVNADHLAVADAICYDGTPDHKERRWARDAGFIAREFTVTWDVTVALIDRGIPFTLTTVEATSAHLQAVVGYDSRRRTLLIRDPGSRYFVETRADPFLSDYSPFGPRGMLMVPQAESARLDGVVLPEAEERDHLHDLRSALDRHERDVAARALDELQRKFPDGGITVMARRNLAAYDGDQAGVAAASAAWHARFPDHQVVDLKRLDDLPDTARAEREQGLEAAVARPGSQAIFSIRLAGLWWWDQRHQKRAESLLRRALRRRGSDAQAMRMLAGIHWERRELEAATRIYRLCACQEITDEDHAQTYFRACRHLRRTEEALDFLRRRAEQAAKRSPYPTRTLFWALDQLDRTEEGFQVLEQALARHGEDGYLLRFVAREYARVGRHDQAERLLKQADGRMRRIDYLAAMAELADGRDLRSEAIARWQEVLAIDPLWMDAHRALARIRGEVDGRAVAVAGVREAAERFPHHRQLQVLLVQWLREDGPLAMEPAIRHLVTVHPTDVWGQRELAWCLVRQKRLDDAEAALKAAQGIDGHCASNENLRGDLLLARGDLAGAQAAWCSAIALDADDTYAIDRLMDTCGGTEDRIRLLRLVQTELERQVTFGDGIESFRSHAQGLLPSETVLGTLRAAHAARPDLWQVWSSLITQLVELDQAEEAERLANGMCARFPLLPRSWLDLARAAHANGQREVELASLEQALQISPTWSYAARRVIDLHLDAGELEEARAAAERSVHHDPLEAMNHLALARVLLAQSDVGRAVASLERAVSVDPGCDRAWDLLARRDFQRALTLARKQSETRAHEARAWFRLAEMLTADEARDERLAALDRALDFNPRFIGAITMKADTLADADRLDEALACCTGGPWGDRPPSVLRRHAAVLEARHGRRDAALVRLRALVAEEPEEAEHWRELAGIAQAAGQHAEAVTAAERFTNLQPRRASAWGYLADARSAAGDRAGAKTAFIRAFELDQAYSFAGHRLFDLYLADKELAPAGEVLEHLQLHAPGEWTTVKAVRWHAASGDADGAFSALEKLLLVTEHEWDAVDRAVEACADLPANDLAALLNRCVANPLAGRRAYYYWAHRWAPTCSPRDCAERLEGLPDGRPRIRATFSYLNWMGEKAPLDQVRAFSERYRAYLHADDECWGATIYALYNRGAAADAARWGDGWQKRANLEAWMLIFLSDALRRVDRWEEGLQANQRAVELARDHTWALHHLWLALETAMAEDAAASARHLAEAKSENDYGQIVLGVAQAVHSYLGPGGSPWALASRLVRVVKERPKPFAEHHELRFLLGRAARVMGRRSHWSWRIWGAFARWYASGWKTW